MRPAHVVLYQKNIEAVCSSEEEVIACATALAKELRHDKVPPLHLVAAMLQDGSGVGEILNRAVTTKEAVIAAIQS